MSGSKDNYDEMVQVVKDDVLKGMIAKNFIPVGAEGDLSPTSHALTCFTSQVFSRRLQEYLLNYRSFITSEYAVNDE